jgi:hypothetical protein
MKVVSGEKFLEKAGKLYLKFRLRNKQKIERELLVKYEGQYRNAGLVLLFDIFMAMAVVVIVCIVALVVYFTAA